MKSSQTYASAVRTAGGAEPKKQQVFLYIDDSNMYLEGTRFYARYQNLHVKQDGRFRVNYADFIRKLISGRKLAKARLYFSNPVEKAERWDGFHAELSKVIAVERFDRSIFGEEKEVDTSITADLVYDLWKFPCAKDEERVFIIVSGDRDFVPALRKVMEEGARAELYAYSQALAGKLKELQKENADRLVIRDLGETLLSQKSIYLESKWHKLDHADNSRVWIPSSRTMIFEFHAALTKVVPPLLAEYCTGCLKIPCYGTAYLNYCLIVVGVNNYDSAMSEKAALERLKGINFSSPYAPQIRSIMTVAEFSKLCKLSDIYSVFSFEELVESDEEFSDLLDEESETASSRADSSCGKKSKKKKKAHKDEGFILVTAKKKRQIESYECHYKFQCQNGVHCGNMHTPDEIRFFKSRFPQRGAYFYKRQECTKSCCEFRDDKALCAYAHGVKDAHCYHCGTIGKHWHEYCPDKVEKKVKGKKYNCASDE